MRIAFVTDTYRPQTNGVVSSIDTIAEILKKKGHRTEIFAPTGDENTNTFPSIPSGIGPDYEIAFLRAKSLENMFDRKGIDLVHIHTPFSLGLAAMRASRNQGLPSVATFHTLLSEYTHYVSESIPDPLERLFVRGTWKYVTEFYKRFEVVTVPSAPIKKMLAERGVKNISVMPNAVDTVHYQPPENKVGGDPCVLFVGRMGKEKKLELLIEAAPEIIEEFPDVRFEIIGKGEHKDWYEKVAMKNGVGRRFNFRGYVGEKELVESYQSCDVFAIPSDTETLGLVALEAMACRTPVVGANARGLKHIISHGDDGFLFTPGSVPELSKYVIELLKDEKLRENMGVKARQKAEKFSAESVGDRWIDFYSKIIG